MVLFVGEGEGRTVGAWHAEGDSCNCRRSQRKIPGWQVT